ncbi:hypothetical protein JCM10213v2_004405 [Rhodosporidiobolus nylandii]
MGTRTDSDDPLTPPTAPFPPSTSAYPPPSFLGPPQTVESPLLSEGSARSVSVYSIDGDGQQERFGGSGSPLARRSTTSTKPFGDTARAIQTGSIGGAYGPYPRHASFSNSPFFSRRTSHMSSSDVAVDVLTHPSSYTPTPDRSDSTFELPRVPYASGYRASPSSTSSSLPRGADDEPTPRPHFLAGGSEGIRRSQLGITSLTGGDGLSDTHFLWEKGNEEVDDFIHEYDPELDAILDKRAWKRATWYTVADTGSLVLIVLVILGVFLGWPVMAFGILGTWQTAHHGGRTDLGHGLGGINASGQVPNIPNLPQLIDKDTPQSAYTMKGYDGDTLNLVFSDEFNRDGRTFWPGDDPYWEAVDLHYWATQDYEWYDPDAVATKDGKLEITLTQEPWRGLNFRSGMLQSWNKFCFTGGRIVVSCSFPGSSTTMGFWPGVWTMGNLGRAGYGASNHGMWPYSYTECDTYPNGTSPAAARDSGSRDYGGTLSYLPGQRASACTCEGEDHPGPNVRVGRGAPEIDVTEQQVDWRGTGSTSQSIQFAPMDAAYGWKNSTPEMTIFDTNKTVQNLFVGAVNQESASLITLTDTTSYEGRGYSEFSFEYEPGPDGKITWFVNDTASWQITAAALGPDPDTEIGQRLISVEPMAINLNLAISQAFQTPNWANLTFPGTFRIDYVRVYQKGSPKVGCDPPDYPTSAYIARHPDIYNKQVFCLL